MALSDSPIGRTLRPARRAIAARKRNWSDGQKLEAVQTFMVLGNLKLVSGTLKIPYDTLKVWKASEWWKTLEGELRVQDDLQLSTRLQRIVAKSYDVVEDRLEHGDFVYDQKTGVMRRKPVAMRDAHKVALDLSDKRDLLIDRHMTGDTITTDKIEKTLQDLAANFERIANQITTSKHPIDVTDVIFGDDEHAKEKP
jgi:hypothetical protein